MLPRSLLLMITKLKPSVIVSIRLILSLLIWPNVLTLLLVLSSLKVSKNKNVFVYIACLKTCGYLATISHFFFSSIPTPACYSLRMIKKKLLLIEIVTFLFVFEIVLTYNFILYFATLV